MYVQQHAAAIVGSKMVVFGGDSGHQLLDDTKVIVVLCVVMDSLLGNTPFVHKYKMF